MDSYATVEDYEERYGPLSEEESKRAEILLEDASVWLDGMLKHDVDNHRAAVIVVCAMVRRKMDRGGAVFGVSQMSQTAGSFNENITFSNPNGDWFLTKGEQKMLGIRRLKCGFMSPWGDCE